LLEKCPQSRAVDGERFPLDGAQRIGRERLSRIRRQREIKVIVGLGAIDNAFEI